VSITDELLENHAAVRASLQPRCLPRPPAKQVAALACGAGRQGGTIRAAIDPNHESI
jgi:hypothetical protein